MLSHVWTCAIQTCVIWLVFIIVQFFNAINSDLGFNLSDSLGYFSRRQTGDIFLTFSQKAEFDTICRKCPHLFSGKIRKIFQKFFCRIFAQSAKCLLPWERAQQNKWTHLRKHFSWRIPWVVIKKNRLFQVCFFHNLSLESNIIFPKRQFASNAKAWLWEN